MQIYYVHADKFKGVCGYILVPCIHLYMFAKKVCKAFNKIKEFVTKFNPQYNYMYNAGNINVCKITSTS